MSFDYLQLFLDAWKLTREKVVKILFYTLLSPDMSFSFLRQIIEDVCTLLIYSFSSLVEGEMPFFVHLTFKESIIPVDHCKANYVKLRLY